ncbi:hypothetical protein C0995_004372, partial [Termitomyces sp. Mi166
MSRADCMPSAGLIMNDLMVRAEQCILDARPSVLINVTVLVDDVKGTELSIMVVDIGKGEDGWRDGKAVIVEDASLRVTDDEFTRVITLEGIIYGGRTSISTGFIGVDGNVVMANIIIVVEILQELNRVNNKIEISHSELHKAVRASSEVGV